MRILRLFKLILFLLCAYLLMIGEYGNYRWNVISEDKEFWIVYLVQVLLVGVYLLVTNIANNIFIADRPGMIQGWPKAVRVTCYYIFASIPPVLLQMGMRKYLFLLYSIREVGNRFSESFFIPFHILLLSYLSVLYFVPTLSPLYHLIRYFCPDATYEYPPAQQSIPYSTGGSTAPAAVILEDTPSIEDAPSTPSETLINNEANKESRIKIRHILLFYFSRLKGSYMIDTNGKKWYCSITQSILKNHPSRRCFVQINRNTFINRLYVFPDPKHKQSILFEEKIAKKIALPPRELNTLRTISRRCRPYYIEFLAQQHATIDGYEDYIYY